MDTMPYTPKVMGYSFRDSELDTIAVQHDGGGAVYRQGYSNNSIPVNVEWKLEGSDIAGFHTFFNTTIDHGSLPFEIDLLIDDTDLTTHKAYFEPNSLKLMWLSSGIQSATAQLNVQPANYDIDAALDMIGLYNEYGGDHGALFSEYGLDFETLFPPDESDLNDIVNTDLPSIDL